MILGTDYPRLGPSVWSASKNQQSPLALFELNQPNHFGADCHRRLRFLFGAAKNGQEARRLFSASPPSCFKLRSGFAATAGWEGQPHTLARSSRQWSLTYFGLQGVARRRVMGNILKKFTLFARRAGTGTRNEHGPANTAMHYSSGVRANARAAKRSSAGSLSRLQVCARSTSERKLAFLTLGNAHG